MKNHNLILLLTLVFSITIVSADFGYNNPSLPQLQPAETTSTTSSSTTVNGLDSATANNTYLKLNGSNANQRINIGANNFTTATSINTYNLYSNGTVEIDRLTSRNFDNVYLKSSLHGDDFSIKGGLLSSSRLNTGRDYIETIPLKTGANIISLTSYNNVNYTKRDINITVGTGNGNFLLGYSGLDSYRIDDLIWTNSSTRCHVINCSGMTIKIYSNGGFIGLNTKRLNNGDSLVIYTYGAGNFTFKDIRGVNYMSLNTIQQSSINISNILVSNGTHIITGQQSCDNGWINCGSWELGAFQYYSKGSGIFESWDGETYPFLPTWVGLRIDTYIPNLELIINQNVTTGEVIGGNAYFQNITGSDRLWTRLITADNVCYGNGKNSSGSDCLVTGYGTTYNVSYNNLLGQNCPAGQAVNGTRINGTLICTAVSGGSMDYTNLALTNITNTFFRTQKINNTSPNSNNYSIIIDHLSNTTSSTSNVLGGAIFFNNTNTTANGQCHTLIHTRDRGNNVAYGEWRIVTCALSDGSVSQFTRPAMYFQYRVSNATGNSDWTNQFSFDIGRIDLASGAIQNWGGALIPTARYGLGLSNVAQDTLYLNDSKFRLYNLASSNSTVFQFGPSYGSDLRFNHTDGIVYSNTALALKTGSASAPSLRSTIDPDTGLYFPFDNDARFTVGGTAWQRWTGGSQPTVSFDSRVRFSWNDGAVGTSTIAGFSLGKNATSGGFKQAINLTGNSATQKTNSTLNTLAVHFAVGDYGNTLPTCGANTNRTLSANNTGLYYCHVDSTWRGVSLIP